MRRPNLFIFILSSSLFFLQDIQANNIELFLKNNAVEINKNFIFDNIRFYLKSRLKNDQIYWFNGSLISKKGERYDKLKIKFNTIDNSLNLKYRKKYYRVSNRALKEFILIEKGKERRFKKGYVTGGDHSITASYNMPTSSILQYISAFENIDDFYFLEISANQKEEDNRVLAIKLRSSISPSITAFKNYLKDNKNFSGIVVNMGKKSERQNIFFEILAQREGISFLKHHSKILSKSETGMVMKEVNTMTLSDNTFYLSNRNNHIQKIYASKKSVVKALKFTELNYDGKVPSILTEKKLVEVLLGII